MTKPSRERPRSASQLSKSASRRALFTRVRASTGWVAFCDFCAAEVQHGKQGSSSHSFRSRDPKGPECTRRVWNLKPTSRQDKRSQFAEGRPRSLKVRESAGFPDTAAGCVKARGSEDRSRVQAPSGKVTAESTACTKRASSPRLARSLKVLRKAFVSSKLK